MIARSTLELRSNLSHDIKLFAFTMFELIITLYDQ